MECIYKFIFLICFSPLGAILYTTAFEIWNKFISQQCLFIPTKVDFL